MESQNHTPSGEVKMMTRQIAKVRAATSGLAVGAMMFGVALGSPTVANAYAGSCVGPTGAGNVLQVREFSLQDAGDGSSLATVVVDAAMSESDAQSFVNRPGEEADFFLFGDDSNSDDLLVKFKPERSWVSPAGLGMRGAVQVPNSTLDEDGLNGITPGPPVDAEYFADKDGGRDEFYADIRMGDIRTGSAHRVETCRLLLAE